MNQNRPARQLAAALLALVVATAALGAQQVAFDRILHPEREPQNWLSYSGNVFNQRYSRLTQITPANVEEPRAAVGVAGTFAREVRGDGAGRRRRAVHATRAAGSGRISGGGARRRHRTAVLDARVHAVGRGATLLRARQPRPRDSRRHAVHGHDRRAPHRASMRRPARSSGTSKPPRSARRYGEVRHHARAARRQGQDHRRHGRRRFRRPRLHRRLRREDGKELWRFYTIPGPGEPGNETWSGDSWKTGGAGVWNSGAYDPETNLVYFGTGNPAPDWDGATRLGDNLYSDSVVALDADTGKLKWHYQFTPHDELDYDSTQVPVLADIEWQGRPRKVMLWANRNGLAYVLDRDHRRVPARQAVRQGELDGRLRQERPAARVPGKVPDAGRRADHAARCSARPTGRRRRYSPQHRPVLRRRPGRTPASIAVEGQFPRAAGVAGTAARRMGQATLTPNLKKEDEGFGVVRALDPKTLEKKWEFKMNDITWAGVLTTASDRGVQRRQGRVFLRPRRAHRRAALEGLRSAARSTAAR